MPSLGDQSDPILADLLDALRREAVNAAAVADPARIVHDLQVHQIELELQNRELRAAQQALEESRDRYVDLYDFAPVAYASLTRQGQITQLNLTAAHLLGMERAQAAGLFLGSWLVPEDRRALQSGLRRALSTDQEVSLEVGLGRVPATRRDLHLTLRREHARVPGEAPSTCRVILADITESKRAALALREADRRKDEFLATLAHELRNPLAAIGSAVAIIQFEGVPAPTVQTARDIIDRQVRRLSRLVDDLLDVSRLTCGKLDLRRERVDLAATLASAVETARPRLDAGRHRLVLALPPLPIDLDADPLRLAQVFTNLLDNAAKFTEPGGTISVTAESDGAAVAVTVADTGSGIAPEDLPGLFEMFFQGGAAPDQRHSGLGIGLALARRLVDLHGGCVEARSAGRGQGSAFVVRLPVPARPPADRPPPSAPLPLRGPGPRCILVADDNGDCAGTLAELLRLCGHQVEIAGDGLEAVAAAERSRPETILLDLGMPNLDGYGACRCIRAQPWGQDIRILALTGWAPEGYRRQSREAGFDGYLVKPVEVTALLQALAAPCAGWGDAVAGSTHFPLDPP